MLQLAPSLIIQPFRSTISHFRDIYIFAIGHNVKFQSPLKKFQEATFLEPQYFNLFQQKFNSLR